MTNNSPFREATIRTGGCGWLNSRNLQEIVRNRPRTRARDFRKFSGGSRTMGVERCYRSTSVEETGAATPEQRRFLPGGSAKMTMARWAGAAVAVAALMFEPGCPLAVRPAGTR